MLPPLTFDGLRHCFASLALASGADIAVVSKLLGHASISITSDVYGHLVGTVASLAPPLGMDAAQAFHRCRSSFTVCWVSTPRIAFCHPNLVGKEPGARSRPRNPQRAAPGAVVSTGAARNQSEENLNHEPSNRR
jgi:hypothetical protein